VEDTSKVAVTTIIGALAGALFGYLYLTESGRQVRVHIEPRIDDFVREVRGLRGTVEKARSAASETWESLNAYAGKPEPWQPGVRSQH
jgi:hypothetical protein